MNPTTPDSQPQAARNPLSWKTEARERHAKIAHLLIMSACMLAGAGGGLYAHVHQAAEDDTAEAYRLGYHHGRQAEARDQLHAQAASDGPQG